MSSTIKTILIIGATSGIGEAFARRFHSMGKKVIATGRRQANLTALARDCLGLETYTMDNSDLPAIAGHVKTLNTTYPDINAVWVNSGMQYSYSFKDDLSAYGDAEIIQEINVNSTAVTLLARHFILHLLALKTEALFMVTSSGIAFFPSDAYPVYSQTKAGVHHLCCVLRQQLADTNVAVVELVPPYVATELDDAHREAAGGMQPMGLEEYTEGSFKILDGTPARELKEVGVGMGEMAVQTWRGAFQPVLDQFGSKA